MGKWVGWGKPNADNLFHFPGLINLWLSVLLCCTTDAGAENTGPKLKKENKGKKLAPALTSSSGARLARQGVFRGCRLREQSRPACSAVVESTAGTHGALHHPGATY